MLFALETVICATVGIDVGSVCIENVMLSHEEQIKYDGEEPKTKLGRISNKDGCIVVIVPLQTFFEGGKNVSFVGC